MRVEFHGEPVGAPKSERYSSQILGDLIGKAKSIKPKVPWLGLFVHPENIGAIKLYERHHFTCMKYINYPHKDFKIVYPRDAPDLDSVDVDSP